MSRPGIRYDPPRVEIGPEIEWAILRAFGLVEQTIDVAPDPGAAYDLARRLDLAPRIAARMGRDRLEAELGEEVALSFLDEYRNAAAVGIQRMGLARLLARTAAEIHVPLVFLKFAALQLAGHLRVGIRNVCDVDVLSPRDGALELHQELVRRGFLSSNLPDARFHLAPLKHPSGGPVEIHTLVAGISLEGEGRDPATFESLRRHGLLEPVSTFPGKCSIPVLEVRIAHTLAHGGAQHALNPSEYPMLRVVADLIDLGIGTDEGEPALRRARARMGIGMSDEEIAAIVGLCRSLSAGSRDSLTPAGAGTAESVLLSHVLAGSLDADYQASVQMDANGARVVDRFRAAGMVGLVRQAFALSREQVYALYGRPKTFVGRLGWRVVHPLRAAARLFGTLANSIGRRIRGSDRRLRDERER